MAPLHAEPFRADHLDGFVPGRIERARLDGLDLARLARENRWRERAVTLRENGRTLGFVSIRWAAREAYVSFLLGDEIRRRPLRMTRAARRGLDALRRQGIRRVHAEARDPAARRWLRILGFTDENGMMVHD